MGSTREKEKGSFPLRAGCWPGRRPVCPDSSRVPWGPGLECGSRPGVLPDLRPPAGEMQFPAEGAWDLENGLPQDRKTPGP